MNVDLTPVPLEDRQNSWPTWAINIDGKDSGIVYLNVPKGRFVVSIDTKFGYGKAVDEAVGDLPIGAGMDEIDAAIRRGYAEHLRVLDRLKVVDRESRPKFVSTPMGGQPK
ncbi:hypothetical protein [Streptomyces wuyuanensis]|uniref:hypothetical protein n=1 Tax=Streptomyces wuyuanensis TaxID=1196353 RepID=UPI00344AF75C